MTKTFFTLVGYPCLERVHLCLHSSYDAFTLPRLVTVRDTDDEYDGQQYTWRCSHDDGEWQRGGQALGGVRQLQLSYVVRSITNSHL